MSSSEYTSQKKSDALVGGANSSASNKRAIYASIRALLKRVTGPSGYSNSSTPTTQATTQPPTSRIVATRPGTVVNPSYIAANSSGTTVFVTNSSDGTIYSITGGNATNITPTILNGPLEPTALAYFDDTLYIADQAGDTSIYSAPIIGGDLTFITSVPSHGLAKIGNFLFSINGTTITRISIIDGTSVTQSDQFINLQAIAYVSPNIYIADLNAGSTVDIYVDDGAGQFGSAPFSTNLVNVSGITVDSTGTIYVTDGINAVYTVDAGGEVLFAGGLTGNVNGPVATAKFNVPVGITVDSSDVLYIADNVNNSIRTIT